jgi:hypothetical protein
VAKRADATAGGASAAAPNAASGAASDAASSAAPADDANPRRLLHFQLVAGAILAISLLKGLRMPNLWAATHLTMNYSHGFIRRGLVGALLKLPGNGWMFNYNRLALLSVAIFVGATVATARLVNRVAAGAPRDTGFQASVLVFAASPGIVFLAHEIGYLDFVGLLAVLGFMALARRLTPRYAIFYVGALLGITLAFIHESMVVMFMPMMLFVMVCYALERGAAQRLSRGPRLAMLAHAFVAAALCFVASSIVGVVGTKPAEVTRELQASIAAVANFSLRTDAFEALSRPVRENLRVLMPWFWRNRDNQAYLVSGLWAVSPGILWLFAYGVLLIRRVPAALWERLLLGAVFFGATFGPLTLNFVGWDAARWNAICLLGSFLCIAALELFFAPRAPQNPSLTPSLTLESPWLTTTAIVAIALGLSTNYERFLFDGYTVHWFPFEGQWRSAVELVRGNFTFMPRW